MAETLLAWPQGRRQLHSLDLQQVLRSPELEQVLHSPELDHNLEVDQVLHSLELDQVLRSHKLELEQVLRSPELRQVLHSPELTQVLHSPELRKVLRSLELNHSLEEDGHALAESWCSGSPGMLRSNHPQHWPALLFSAFSKTATTHPPASLANPARRTGPTPSHPLGLSAQAFRGAK